MRNARKIDRRSFQQKTCLYLQLCLQVILCPHDSEIHGLSMLSAETHFSTPFHSVLCTRFRRKQISSWGTSEMGHDERWCSHSVHSESGGGDARRSVTSPVGSRRLGRFFGNQTKLDERGHLTTDSSQRLSSAHDKVTWHHTERTADFKPNNNNVRGGYSDGVVIQVEATSSICRPPSAFFFFLPKRRAWSGTMGRRNNGYGEGGIL